MPEPTAEEIAAAQAKADADAQAKADAEAKAKAEADAKAAKEVTLKQADLDRIAGQSRQEGRTQAEKDLLEKLGVADIDAAAAAIKAHTDATEAQKTELQKAQDRAAAAEAQVEAANKLTTTTLAVTRIEGALRDSGLKPERIPAALRLVDLSKITVDGTNVSGITEAVEGLKTETPEWFGAARSSAPDATGGGDTGGGIDYRTATKAELDKEVLAKYGVRL
jgi:hypothetical protein